MADITRDDLERQAMEEVCSCFYWELANEMESTPDDALRRIIEHPMSAHYEQQLHQPVSVDEFIESLRECPSYKEGK